MDARQLLDEVHAAVHECRACGLARGRLHAVPGEGAHDARVMFVGEGPGQQEDQQGRPFVGPAGRVLSRLMLKAGLRRSEVYITNTVKCRPPGNRDPEPDEIAACNDFLVAQIAIIQPCIICPLGAPAIRTLLDPRITVARVHGRPVDKDGITHFPMYHPAAGLHNHSLRGAIERDFVNLGQLLRDRGIEA